MWWLKENGCTRGRWGVTRNASGALANPYSWPWYWRWPIGLLGFAFFWNWYPENMSALQAAAMVPCMLLLTLPYELIAAALSMLLLYDLYAWGKDRHVPATWVIYAAIVVSIGAGYLNHQITELKKRSEWLYEVIKLHAEKLDRLDRGTVDSDD